MHRVAVPCDLDVSNILRYFENPSALDGGTRCFAVLLNTTKLNFDESVSSFYDIVRLQWFEHIEDHENMFGAG